MSEFGLLCLQIYDIILLCILIVMIVTPFAIWLDNIEEKHKQLNNNNNKQENEEKEQGDVEDYVYKDKQND